MRVRDKGASTFAKRYRIEAVYNQEDDVHHSTLSTGQTRGWNVEGSTGQRRTPAHAASALNATLGAYFCGMLNSDSTGGVFNKRVTTPCLRRGQVSGVSQWTLLAHEIEISNKVTPAAASLNILSTCILPI